MTRETLTTDYDLMEFHKLFSYLDFHGTDVQVLLAIALMNSGFSGSIKTSVHPCSSRPIQSKTPVQPAHFGRIRGCLRRRAAVSRLRAILQGGADPRQIDCYADAGIGAGRLGPGQVPDPRRESDSKGFSEDAAHEGSS